MRVNTVRVLILAALLAACGGSGDTSDGMMDHGSGMMEDSAQMMDDAMESDMMEAPAMDDSSVMDDGMGDGAVARDTTEMRRP